MIQEKKVRLGISSLALVGMVLFAGLLPESRAYQEAMILGNSLRADSAYRAAIDAYRMAHAVRPSTVLPRLSEAQVDLMLDRPGDALSLYRQMATERGPRPDVLIGWGQAYYALSDSERALPLWRQALELGATDAHYHLGMAHLSLGDWEEAANHLVESLPTNEGGNHSQVTSYWLGILRAPDSPGEAQEYMEMASRGPDEALSADAQTIIQALRQSRRVPESRLTRLGTTLFGLGHWNMAQAYFERALHDNPEDVEALAYLGATLDQQGDNPAAETALKRALDIEPDHMPSLYFWGKHQMYDGAVLTAREAFARMLSLDPRNAAVCAEIGRTFAAEGKYQLAEEWFEASIGLAPDRSDFHMILAEFEGDTVFDLRKGLTAAEEAVAADPDDPLTHDLLGWMLYLTGRWAEAESALYTAISLAPRLTGAYYHLGKLYQSQHRYDQARWAFGRAVDLGAGSPSQDLAEDCLRLLDDGPEASPLIYHSERNASR